jgi:hypothetical protein
MTLLGVKAGREEEDIKILLLLCWQQAGARDISQFVNRLNNSFVRASTRFRLILAAMLEAFLRKLLKSEKEPNAKYSQYLKDRYAGHVDQHKMLHGFSFEMGGKHDQWVLTLSGGALGLSITFLDKIASHPLPCTKYVLGISWACLAFSLLAAFYGIHFSGKAISRQIEILDQEYSHFILTTTEENPEGTTPPNSINEFNKVTDIWSALARYFTVIGVSLLCFFCFLNLRSLSSTPTNETLRLSVDDKIAELLKQQIEQEKIDVRPDKTTENGKGELRTAPESSNTTPAKN